LPIAFFFFGQVYTFAGNNAIICTVGREQQNNLSNGHQKDYYTFITQLLYNLNTN